MRLAVALALATVANADVYIQMPRGSNNRLDEENRDRNNANRLFDSQNNNRGGYNVGQIYYYAGSVVPMDWTQQHSCGGVNNNCEIIIQYMCDDRIRDGTTTQTIPDDPNECYNWDCDTDTRYGRHESYEWYQDCKAYKRNTNLFIANQNIKGYSARYTRQNPNGNRRGYECPEERDYYPYWRPSPWKDLAIMTNQAGRCDTYKAESENVKGRYKCVVPAGWKYQEKMKRAEGYIPIDQEGCGEVLYYNAALNLTEAGRWMLQPAHNVPAPECRETVWSRDNHHGNSPGGYFPSYNWTIPGDFATHERCVIRLRYNISTNDFDHFDANTRYEDASAEAGVIASLGSPDVDAENNALYDRYEQPAELDVWSKFGLTYNDSMDSFDPKKNKDQDKLMMSREYVLKDNPQVNLFGEDLLPGKALKLQLAINTAQLGRTFEDRTHRFAVRPRPAALADVTIHNLQVRGKRGNVVQTYPGTEYDFFPFKLHAREGDFVHFQWTGSNTNPNNNAGQGRQGTDRHNVVILKDANYNEFAPMTDPATKGQWGNSYPGRIDDPWPFLGLSKANMQTLAILDSIQFGGEMSELDDAGTYFDLGPQQVTAKGIYHYLCTRNNNFSNRSQKGKIVVGNTAVTTAAMGTQGGSIQAASSMVTVPPGALISLELFTIGAATSDTPSGLDGDASGDYLQISPINLPLAAGQKVMVSVPYETNPLGDATMYRANTMAGPFESVDDVEYDSGLATTWTSQGGVYVVRNPLGAGPVIGIVVACLVAVGLCGWVAMRKKAGESLLPGR